MHFTTKLSKSSNKHQIVPLNNHRYRVISRDREEITAVNRDGNVVSSRSSFYMVEKIKKTVKPIEDIVAKHNAKLEKNAKRYGLGYELFPVKFLYRTISN